MNELLASKKKKLAEMEKQFGRDKPEISPYLESLAILHRMKGENDLAIVLGTRRVAISEKALKSSKDRKNIEPRENVAASLYELAMTYRIREETRSLASPLLERALDIRREIYGSNHRLVGDILNALALLYASMKKYKEASSYHSDALDIYHRAILPLKITSTDGTIDTVRLGVKSKTKVVASSRTLSTVSDSEGSDDSDLGDLNDVGLSWNDFKMFKTTTQS